MKKFLILILPWLAACEVETPVSPQCILESIEYADNSRLEFVTLSGGVIYQLRQVYTRKEETTILASFQFVYFQDSVVIHDQITPGKLPYITVKLRNDEPIRVIKYYALSDVQLIFDIKYDHEQKIRIDLTRLASNGASLLAGYAKYHLNERQNVVRIEKYEIDQEGETDFILAEDRSFIYDTYKNPFKGLYLPFFSTTDLPDVKFFSKNNILDIQEQNEVYRYVYQYGERNNTQVLTDPFGQFIRFNYLNCP